MAGAISILYVTGVPSKNNPFAGIDAVDVFIRL